VPLHPKKERKRGYNQATWIAKGIADALEVDVQQALERVEHKKSLTTLNRIERWKQSGELYRNSSIDITGKRLLLVDDVVTTGSTLDSCGNILMEKEPQALYIGALAQAMKRY
ncbi:MAG: phosphoribosyltransferase family protein, partial [Flavobacteriales bacterium]|nr:phosphoribosyltransferase family protein [Flavobacteriales bacterium]